MPVKKPVSKYDSDEMDSYTDGYVELIQELIAQAKQECNDPVVLIEQRAGLFYKYVPGGFGSRDCVIMRGWDDPHNRLQYGQGVLVEAEDNAQMKLYASVHWNFRLHLRHQRSIHDHFISPARKRQYLHGIQGIRFTSGQWRSSSQPPIRHTKAKGAICQACIASFAGQR